jgi:hypothetical protein
MKKLVIGSCAFAAISLFTEAAIAGVLEDIGQAIVRIGSQGQKSPSLYLAAGFKVNLDGTTNGRVVKVFGEDKCPTDWMDRRAGSAATTGCIALDKPQVIVHFDRETELWTVKKDGERISLVRPNGVLVSQAR